MCVNLKVGRQTIRKRLCARRSTLALADWSLPRHSPLSGDRFLFRNPRPRLEGRRRQRMHVTHAWLAPLSGFLSVSMAKFFFYFSWTCVYNPGSTTTFTRPASGTYRFSVRVRELTKVRGKKKRHLERELQVLSSISPPPTP